MRIAVTGRQGQVVQSLFERANSTASGDRVECISVARPTADLNEPETIVAAIEQAQPDIVVSAAAYTAVDAAETDETAAMAINAIGAGTVAKAAVQLGVPIIHLSTDYVFSGSLDRPYNEDDPTGPVGVYGASKLEGEHLVAAVAPDHAILRLAWVYSPFGKNFAKTMLSVARQRDELSVVADQYGTPGNALDIADGIIAVAKNLLQKPADMSLRGVFHMAAEGETTWAGFAEQIFASSKALGGPFARVKPIPTSDYPTPAKRPANSRMDASKLYLRHGVKLPHWQTSVPGCVRRLLADITGRVSA